MQSLHTKHFVNILIIIILISSRLLSQDLIFIKNDTIKCQIISDSITFLKYKIFNSLDTTNYKISQSDYEYYIKNSNQNNQSKKPKEVPNNYNDYIILKEGNDKIKCKILEDKITHLLYKLANSIDTNTYKITQADYDYFIISTDNKTNYELEFSKEIPIVTAKSKDLLVKGAYRTFYEFINNKPSLIFDFKVIQRSNSSVAMYGGTTFKIKNLDDSIKMKNIKNDFWGLCDGKNIYINCKVFLKQKSYSFLTIEKEQAYFYANSNYEYNEDVIVAGMMFGAIGGMVAASNNSSRALYRLDYNTGAISIYNK